MSSPASYKYNPIQGMTLLAVLQFGSGWPAGATRIRLNAAELLQALLVTLTEAELMARAALGEPPIQGGLPTDLVLGARYAQMKAIVKGPDTAAARPSADAYLATMAVARWLPENVTVPYAGDPELFIPSTPLVPGASLPNPIDGTVKAGLPLAAYVTIGVVGVAAAAAAALAYWGGKRADAEASVQVDSLRALSAVDAAQKVAMAQVAAGQKVDPELAKVFQNVGESREVARSWAVPVCAATAGVLVIGGTALAVWKS